VPLGCVSDVTSTLLLGCVGRGQMGRPALARGLARTLAARISSDSTARLTHVARYSVGCSLCEQRPDYATRNTSAREGSEASGWCSGFEFASTSDTAGSSSVDRSALSEEKPPSPRYASVGLRPRPARRASGGRDPEAVRCRVRRRPDEARGPDPPCVLGDRSQMGDATVALALLTGSDVAPAGSAGRSCRRRSQHPP
jgi:hypothetical protein